MLLLSAQLALMGCSYDVPLDPDGPDLKNSISGAVVISGASEASTVVILVYNADDPPPPAGLGRPVSLATVPASDFSGSSGLLEAEYMVSELPDGSYLVNALMDVDSDFHPLLSAAAGGTCGDMAGTYPVSATELSSSPVEVSGGELVDGVTVVVALEYQTERPAFTMADGASISQTKNGGIGGVFTLTSTAVHAMLGDIPLDFTDPGTTCGPLFLVRFTDDDADSFPDPHPVFGDLGLFNAWPKVYLEYLGDGDVTLEPGERYFTEAPIYPAPFVDTKTGALPVNTLIPTPTLLPYFVPGVQHQLPDGTLELVQAPSVPQGSWNVTVVLETGQTWTLPNELAGFPSTDAGFDPLSQASVLTITQ
jgi:hypothetical protein